MTPLKVLAVMVLVTIMFIAALLPIRMASAKNDLKYLLLYLPVYILIALCLITLRGLQGVAL